MKLLQLHKVYISMVIFFLAIQIGDMHGHIYLNHLTDQNQVECLDLSRSDGSTSSSDCLDVEGIHIFGQQGCSQRYMQYYGLTGDVAVWDLATQTTVRTVRIGRQSGFMHNNVMWTLWVNFIYILG